jgi:hypothetical protein
VASAPRAKLLLRRVRFVSTKRQNSGFIAGEDVKRDRVRFVIISPLYAAIWQIDRQCSQKQQCASDGLNVFITV